MLTVHVRKGLLGEDGIATKELPWQAGVTARSIALHLQDALPSSIPIDVAVNGVLLEEDYDDPLQDGDEVILCPHTTAGIEWAAYLAYAFVVAVVSAGVNFAIQALTPKPKAPDDSFERGDNSSATYAWDGIKTNYGQGWTVPAVYGRHAVGGQVIETNVQGIDFGGNANTNAWLSNRLQILLALSEGPIHAVGDLEVSENDFLGSITNIYNPTNPISLPSDIYINDTLLVNDGQPELTTYQPQFGGNNWQPGTPDINVADVVYYWDYTTNAAIPTTEQVDVIRVFGNSANPAILMSANYPAAVVTALAAGNDVRIQINGNAANHQPQRKLLSTTSALVNEVRGSAGCLMYLRSGELDQSPLPPGVPNAQQSYAWENTQSTIRVQRELVTFGQTVEISIANGTNVIDSVRFIVSFPGGLFKVDPNGNTLSFTVRFVMRWRYAGDAVWQDLNGGSLASATAASSLQFKKQFDASFNQEVTGDIELQVERRSGSGETGTSSRAVVQDVVLNSPYELSYPRVATMGLILSAGARFSGGMPQIQARIDGIKVRVWDETNGWSPRCWDVPASPFDWHTYAPGRNPAWILADFMLQPWGLGDYLTEDDLDLPSFARWAVWCDRDPNPSDLWNEAQLVCDLVIDQPRPAWEWVQTICAAGRATPVYVDGKISIVYQYSAAHSQGSVSVPAKTSTQLFTSNNIQDCSVKWLSRADRATAFVYQFLNEDENYKQDVLTIEDAEGTLNDPTELHKDKWRPEQQQAYGVTRASQLFRDGVFRHRINRLVTRRIDFKTGRWALAAQIGDYIDVETEVMRPFDSTVPTSGVVLVGGTSVAAITVDHPSLPAVGQIKYRNADGNPELLTWASSSSTTIEGTVCSVLTFGGGDVATVSPGATCVFGLPSKLVEQYEVVAITLNEDLSRNVTALQVVPAVHDDIDPDTYTDGASTGSAVNAQSSTVQEPKIDASQVRIHRQTNGDQRISWPGVSLLGGVTKRVYTRASESEGWSLLGSTEQDYLDIKSIAPSSTLEIAVTQDSFDGESKQPDSGSVVSIVGVDFCDVIVPAVGGVEVSNRSDLQWSPVTTDLAEEYEVREGESWVGARVLYRGTDPRVTWAIPPLAATMHVCVENEDGSQGQPTKVTVHAADAAWIPDGSSTFIDTNVVQDATGTFTNTEIKSSSYIQLIDGKFQGTYTSPTLAPGFKGTYLWRVEIDARELDGVLVEDVLDRLGSGELNWRCVDAREASRYQIGVDFTRDVDDATDKVDSYKDENAAGYIGAAGHHTRARIEGRFNDGDAWSAWEVWTDQYRNAEQAQVRVVLDRETLQHELQLHKLRITAQL